MEVIYGRLAKLSLENPDSLSEGLKLVQEVTHFLVNDDNPDQAVTKIIASGLIPNFAKALSSEHKSIHTPVAKLLAEIAKHEDARSVCLENEMIPPLLKYSQGDDLPLATQACRVLGNLCFDYDPARDSVDAHGGVEVVCASLARHVSTPGDEGRALRRVLCGALLNIANSQESLQDKAVGAGAIGTLVRYLAECKDEPDTLLMALAALGVLVESELSENALKQHNVVSSLVGLLDSTHAAELTESLLNILACIAENDTMKLELCGDETVSKLLALIAQNQHSTDDDALSTVKGASDLLNTLLTHEESMERLYSGGEGRLVQSAIDWLAGSHLSLQSTGALIIGNFAQRDSHCQALVAGGAHTRLLACLESSDSGEESPGVQHAVCSALRNLAIPVSNKKVLIECGALDKLVGLARTAEHTPVIFKLVATLRMLVDKQEKAATQLGKDKQFLERLVTWCGNEDHAGVRGESRRLSASLVRHSGSSEVMATVATSGLVSPLAEMAHCEFAVMQSEALVALTLMAASCLEQVKATFTEAGVVAAIKSLLTEAETIPEVLCNAAALVIAISKSGSLLQLVRDAEIPQLFKQLQNHDDTQLKTQAAKVVDATS